MENICRRNVRIFSCCNNNYVPYLSTLINSINRNVTMEYDYEIIIAGFDISDRSIQKILSMDLQSNVNVIFRKIENEEMIINSSKWNFGRWSKELYITILAPYIFKEYDKIIYMDCDVINLFDLAYLYNKEIGDNLVAASRMLGRCCMENNGFGTRQVLDYEKDKKISQLGNYFNNGIMLLNLKALRKEYSLKKLLNIISENEFELLDQDCINYLCKDRVLYVEAGWNWYPYTQKEFENVIDLCPSKYKSYFWEGFKIQRNIHFTIPVKPWLEPMGIYSDCSSLFWDNAIETPFYKDIIKRMNMYQKEKILSQNMKIIVQMIF